MTNFGLSLFMGFIPTILYFLIYVRMNQKLYEGQRVTTNVLGRKGQVLSVAKTHSFVRFDDGQSSWYSNQILEEDCDV
jgi:hypothetical protein